MLPKDKAKELVDKYGTYVALIIVNELIQEFNFNSANQEAKSYWIEVKNEI